MTEIRTVAVLGAGTMGHGIAQICAAAGMEVRLYDVDTQAVQAGADRVRANLAKGIARGKVSEEERDGTLARLSTETVIALAVDGADLVVEAAPESMELKAKIFAEVDQVAPDHAILASNTSSLSISEISEAVADPTRFIGMHFFNPVHILKLLEIVVAEQTSDATLATVRAVGDRMNRELVVVKDSPGFASSRLGLCLGLEAIRMVEQGVASAEDIDTAVRLGLNHPMGPLALADFIGLDTCLAVMRVLHEGMGDSKYRPCPLLVKYVEAGWLGRKTGRGFYYYGGKEPVATR